MGLSGPIQILWPTMIRRPGKLMVTSSCFFIGQAVAVSVDWFSQTRSCGQLWSPGQVNSWSQFFLLSDWSSSCSVIWLVQPIQISWPTIIRRPGKLMATISCFLIGQAVAVSFDWFSQSRSCGQLWSAGQENSWSLLPAFWLVKQFQCHLIGSANPDIVANYDPQAR